MFEKTVGRANHQSRDSRLAIGNDGIEFTLKNFNRAGVCVCVRECMRVHAYVCVFFMLINNFYL